MDKWQDESIEKVVEFMDAYFISQENFDSVMLMSRSQVNNKLWFFIHVRYKFIVIIICVGEAEFT